MRFAVDIDNTVTAWPDEFRILMESLKEVGHKVWMLTGGLDKLTSSQPYRENQLSELGIERGMHYDDIHICISDSEKGVARLKGSFCKSKGINVVFDDMAEYLEEVRKQSPDTLCLRVID